MAKRLELTFSPVKDGEIVRFIQLNKDAETSPMFICAIEYHLATGEYMNIGTVCTKNLGNETKPIRKPIYVPMNSIVGPWADNMKAKKQGLLSIKVRQILKSSIRTTDSEEKETVLDYEKCVLEVDKVLDSASIEIVTKPTTPVNRTQKAKSKEQADMLDGFAIVVKETTSNEGLEEESTLIKDPEEQKRTSASLMDKLMPKGEW